MSTKRTFLTGVIISFGIGSKTLTPEGLVGVDGNGEKDSYSYTGFCISEKGISSLKGSYWFETCSSIFWGVLILTSSIDSSIDSLIIFLVSKSSFNLSSYDWVIESSLNYSSSTLIEGSFIGFLIEGKS